MFFSALDWNDDNGAVGPLSRKSFQLHEELSKELKSDIDYRRLNTLSVCAKKSSNGGRNKGTKKRKIPNWLNGKKSVVNNVQDIGNKNTTAQVNFFVNEKENWNI